MCSVLLFVFPLLLAAAVDVTVTPNTTHSLSSQVITVHVTGLANGSVVLIDRVIDANGNGAVDAGEFRAEAFRITDGQTFMIAGVRNINVPGDEDGAVDGQLTYQFVPSLGAELGRVAGQHLIRVSSPTADFEPIIRTLTVNQPTLAGAVTGTVTDGANPVPHAAVVLLDAANDGEFALAALADASGNFSVNAPAGTFFVIPTQHGYVTGFDSAGMAVVGDGPPDPLALVLTPATTTLSGRITRTGTTNGVPGVQLFIESTQDQIVITSTNFDGTYSVPVTAGQWRIEPSEISLSRLAYIGPDGFAATANTTQGAAADVDFSLPRANALIHGTVLDDSGNPVVGLRLGANTMDHTLRTDAMTRAGGAYTLGVIAGQWSIYFPSDDPVLANYVPPAGSSLTVNQGEAIEQNHTLLTVTARLQGTITRNGNPLSYARLGAYNQTLNLFAMAQTGEDGAFDLGLVAGDWSVQLQSETAQEHNVVSPLLFYTLTDDEIISDINFAVIDRTAQITGVVRGDGNQPVSGGNVFANATIGGINYFAFTQLGGGGSYSLDVANGTWNITPNIGGYPTPPPTQVVVTGSNVVRDLTVSNAPIIFSHPSNQSVTEGNGFFFSVSAQSFLTLSFQWQASVDGENWTDLVNNATYSGAQSGTLTGTSSLILNGRLYRCVVTNTAGTATSNPATLTVQAAATSPSFNTHPFDSGTPVGTTVQFSASASGSPPLSYRWQVSPDGDAWQDIFDGPGYSGTDSTTLTVHNVTLAQNGTSYRLVATNPAGSATSGHGRLTVYETFDTWRQAQFTLEQQMDPAISGNLATPAGDGVPNLVKYAFGINPFTPAAGLLPQPDADTGMLTLEFTALRGDIQYEVQASTNLTQWSGAGVQMTTEGTYRRASYPLTGNAAVFLRIVVTRLQDN